MNPSFVVVNDSYDEPPHDNYDEPPGGESKQKSRNYWQDDALEQDETCEWGSPLAQPHNVNENIDGLRSENECEEKLKNLFTNSSEDDFSDIATEDDFKEAFDEGFGFEDEDDFDLDEDELNPEILLQSKEKLDGLLESFLDLEQPKLNRNMINFLKTDKATQRFLRFLSRLPENITVDDGLPEVNYSTPIPQSDLRNNEDPRAIRTAKLSYNLMALLSPVSLPEQKFETGEEYVGDHSKTYVMCKIEDICAHALCCFHPISKGNPHHASYILEAALSSVPTRFYNMVCRNKLARRLFKILLMRGSHRGRAADLIGNMISLMPHFGSDLVADIEQSWETAEELEAKIIKVDQLLKNAASDQASSELLATREEIQKRFDFVTEKRKFFKLIKEWNFFECIINVVASCTESDKIVFTYAHFFMDLMVACSIVPDGELLLSKESAVRLTKTLFEAALDPKNRRGHRTLIVQLLLNFLTHVSKENFRQEVPNSILFLGLAPPAPKPNRFHKLLVPTLGFVLSQLPTIVETLSSPQSIGPKKIRRLLNLTPFGTLRLALLRLLTTCFSLSRLMPHNNISLSVVKPKCWEMLFQWVLTHGSNTFLLLEFSKLIEHSYGGSSDDQAFLLYLLRECRFLEKLIEYYTTNPRTPLHSFTLLWLSKLQNSYQNDVDSNTSEGMRSEDSTEFTADWWRNEECKENEITSFIKISKAYNEFLPTLNTQLNLQKLKEVPNFTSGSGNSQLEYLLQALLTSVSKGSEHLTSQEEPDDAVKNDAL